MVFIDIVQIKTEQTVYHYYCIAQIQREQVVVHYYSIVQIQRAGCNLFTC